MYLTIYYLYVIPLPHSTGPLYFFERPPRKALLFRGQSRGRPSHQSPGLQEEASAGWPRADAPSRGQRDECEAQPETVSESRTGNSWETPRFPLKDFFKGDIHINIQI